MEVRTVSRKQSAMCVCAKRRVLFVCQVSQHDKDINIIVNVVHVCRARANLEVPHQWNTYRCIITGTKAICRRNWTCGISTVVSSCESQVAVIATQRPHPLPLYWFFCPFNVVQDTHEHDPRVKRFRISLLQIPLNMLLDVKSGSTL